ncbi:MAG: hypothetical protein ACF8XB_21075 [Planctomycetota bacterium JB042]
MQLILVAAVLVLLTTGILLWRIWLDTHGRRDDLPPRGEPNEPNPNWSEDDRPEDIFGKP